MMWLALMLTIPLLAILATLVTRPRFERSSKARTLATAIGIILVASYVVWRLLNGGF